MFNTPIFSVTMHADSSLPTPAKTRSGSTGYRALNSSPSSPHTRCPHLTGHPLNATKGNPVNSNQTSSAPTQTALMLANPFSPNEMSYST